MECDSTAPAGSTSAPPEKTPAPPEETSAPPEEPAHTPAPPEGTPTPSTDSAHTPAPPEETPAKQGNTDVVISIPVMALTELTPLTVNEDSPFNPGRNGLGKVRTMDDLLKLCAIVTSKDGKRYYTVAAVNKLEATASDIPGLGNYDIGRIISLRERSPNLAKGQTSPNPCAPTMKSIVVTSAVLLEVDTALRAQGIEATIYSTDGRGASTEETIMITTRPIKDESKSKSSGKPPTSRTSQAALFGIITAAFKHLNMDTVLKSAVMHVMLEETNFPDKAKDEVRDIVERFQRLNVPKKKTADQRLIAGNAADPAANSATNGKRATALQLEGCFTRLFPSEDFGTAVQNICAKTENPLSAQAKIFMVLVLAKKQDIPVQFVLDRLKDVPITDGMLPWNRLKMLVQETEHESKMNKPAATAPVPTSSDDIVVDAVPQSSDDIVVDAVPQTVGDMSVAQVPPSTDGISVDMVPQSVGYIIVDAVTVTVESVEDAEWVKARPMIEDTIQAGAADTVLADAVPVSVVSPAKATKRRRGTSRVDTQVDPRVDPQVDPQVGTQAAPHVAPDAPRRRKKAKRRRN